MQSNRLDLTKLGGHAWEGFQSFGARALLPAALRDGATAWQLAELTLVDWDAPLAHIPLVPALLSCPPSLHTLRLLHTPSVYAHGTLMSSGLSPRDLPSLGSLVSNSSLRHVEVRNCGLDMLADGTDDSRAEFMKSVRRCRLQTLHLTGFGSRPRKATVWKLREAWARARRPPEGLRFALSGRGGRAEDEEEGE